MCTPIITTERGITVAMSIDIKSEKSFMNGLY